MRASAAEVVARVLIERIAVEEALANATNVARRDESLRSALVLGALRWHHRLHWQAEQLLANPLKAKQAKVAALLRIGLLQLQFLRIPDHAAVSATVDAAAVLGEPKASGLVNAVLRRFLRERSALEARSRNEPEALFSHPQWMIDAVRADWPTDWQGILEENNRPGPMWLRVNRLHQSRATYLDRLAAAGLAARAAEDEGDAVSLAEPVPVDELPGFTAGDVSVQDVAAQRAARHLALEPGLRVLDACAAPGGKTCHILESCQALAEVVALDRDAKRLERVTANLSRLGLSASVVRGDATRPEQWWDGRPFDRILLDAPCSALGVIRRHPDIKVLRRPEDVDRAAAVQAALLEALWPLLERGGRLVYATCTLLRRENHAQIEAFLAATPDARPLGPAAPRAGQSLPGEAGGDGFFYACLAKPDVVRSRCVSQAQQ